MPRLSAVDTINVKSIAFASTFLIGDSVEITPVSRALAVQREELIFIGHEGDFKQFPIFSQPIPKPLINENISIVRENQQPTIKVGNINVIGVSSSSILQIGSSKWIDAEARVKHIRQLRDVE